MKRKNSAIIKAFKKLSQTYHDDKYNGSIKEYAKNINKSEKEAQKIIPEKIFLENYRFIQVFKELFENLPLIYNIELDGDKLTNLPKSKRKPLLDFNDEFKGKDVKAKNIELKQIINNNNKYLKDIYKDYDNKCTYFSLNNEIFKESELVLTLNGYNIFSKLFLSKLPEEEKADYKELFDNYAKLYQKCFKEEDDNNKGQGMVVTKFEEAEEQARKDAEAAEQAKKDLAAEQAKKDAAAEKAKIEATIVNKENIVLLKKIDVLKVEYKGDIVQKVADTIQSHKVEFTEEGINELAKSHEVISNNNDYSNEEVVTSYLCVDHGIC